MLNVHVDELGLNLSDVDVRERTIDDMPEPLSNESKNRICHNMVENEISYEEAEVEERNNIDRMKQENGSNNNFIECTMREVADQIIDKINKSLEKRAKRPLLTLDEVRTIKLSVAGELRVPYLSQIWHPESKRVHEQWPHKILTALKERGHIANFRMLDEFNYQINA